MMRPHALYRLSVGALLLATVPACHRKDTEASGPRLRWDPIKGGYPFTVPDQDTGESLAKAWLAAKATPDPVECIGGIITGCARWIPVKGRAEAGAPIEIKREDLDACPFFIQMTSLGSGMPFVAVYARSARGDLVYDHAHHRWAWVQVNSDFESVQSHFVEDVVCLRDQAIKDGIPIGWDEGETGMSLNRGPSPLYRGDGGPRLDQQVASLPMGTELWAVSVQGDFLLVAPGEARGRVSGGGGETEDHLKVRWHPDRMGWIRWREDGPVPGSKRVLIRGRL